MITTQVILAGPHPALRIQLFDDEDQFLKGSFNFYDLSYSEINTLRSQCDEMLSLLTKSMETEKEK